MGAEARREEQGPGGQAEPAAGTERDEQQAGLEAEQESAAAMDADVPQPPDASRTTEGQPS